MGINYLQKVDEVERKTFAVDKSKTKFHKVVPMGLELILYESDGNFSTYLNVRSYNSCTVGTAGWTDKKEALKEFKKIAKEIEKGRYTLHLHGNGKIELDVKY